MMFLQQNAGRCNVAMLLPTASRWIAPHVERMVPDASTFPFSQPSGNFAAAALDPMVNGGSPVKGKAVSRHADDKRVTRPIDLAREYY